MDNHKLRPTAICCGSFFVALNCVDLFTLCKLNKNIFYFWLLLRMTFLPHLWYNIVTMKGKEKPNETTKERKNMKQYKGYYIDHVIFDSEEEIDRKLESDALAKFAWLNQYFAKHPSMEAANACAEQARYLHNEFGYPYEEIEALELKAIS